MRPTLIEADRINARRVIAGIKVCEMSTAVALSEDEMACKPVLQTRAA